MAIFDGKKIRQEILDDLVRRMSGLVRQPVLSVVWVGEDKVTARYVEIKQRLAENLGIHFDLIKYPEDVSEAVVISKIEELNADSKVDGIMIQIPLPRTIDQYRIINAISPDKDVDALRFCANQTCAFKPPVIGAILKALELSGKDIAKSSIAIIGKGFLVGSPLIRVLESEAKDLRVADSNTPYLATITLDADIVISATGKPGIIQPNMVKDKVVLIDAGTSEAGGALLGDIDPKTYAKASYYTPVPGGIGPVTVAMLFSNVVMAAEKKGQFNRDSIETQ